MSLWYKLTHRTYSSNVFISEQLGSTKLTITTPIYEVLIQHIMWDWLNMDYYWTWSYTYGFSKVWDLDVLMENRYSNM